MQSQKGLKGKAVNGILVDEATTSKPGLTQALAMAEKGLLPMLTDSNQWLKKYEAKYVDGDKRAKNKAARKARKTQRKCRK